MGEPGSEFFVNIEYESTDGINYTRTDTNSPFVDFTVQLKASPSEWSPWNDAFGYFFNIGKEKPINIGQLFASATGIQNINLDFLSGYFTNYSYEGMFQGCSNVETIDLSTIKLISGTNHIGQFNNMFKDCTSLTTIIGLETLGEDINISDANNYLAGMFEGCTSLETINMSNWQNCTIGGSIGLMCLNCSSLKNANLQSINGDVRNLSQTFRGCSSLETLDLRNANLSTVASYGWGNSFTDVPLNCEIIVKDQASKEAILSHFPNLTNVKLVSELTGV